jgi:general secretion pathway protein B
MSFILDALKKSEHERQRQSMPGMIEIPAPSRRRGIPAWVWVVAGLLLVNVGVLLVLLLRSGAAGTPLTVAIPATPVATNEPRVSAPAARELPARSVAPEPAPAATPPGNLEQSAHPSDHFSPLDNQPVYAPEIPVQDNSVASTTDRAAPPAHAARRSDPVLNDESPDDQEMLPSISELNLTGKQTLPDINIDVHVYASRPADRFVYINMRKYREGAVLQEGPILERIRRDGVVLNYNGLRFLVPRQ